MIRVSDYVVEYLSNLGVKNIFTVSGGGSIHLCDTLHKIIKLDIYHVIMNKQLHCCWLLEIFK